MSNFFPGVWTGSHSSLWQRRTLVTTAMPLLMRKLTFSQTDKTWKKALISVLYSILQHLTSTLTKSTREKILYLTTLVTLSDRIGHSSYIPAVRRGTYELEFEQAKEKVLHKQSREQQSSLPPAKRAKLDKTTAKARWPTVSDMTEWVKCPLGLAPGQTVSSPTMFDLPACLDKAIPSDSTPSKFPLFFCC